MSTRAQLIAYLFVGGPALVEKTLAEEYFPNDVLEREMVPDPLFGGFKSIRGLPATSLCRAPRPKLRMNVLRRDLSNCRICGRKPDDHADVELHVHHMRPWEDGGLTEEHNLVTLCHTCHKGLSPHNELTPRSPTPDGDKYLSDLLAGMKRYQKMAKETYEASLMVKRPKKKPPRRSKSKRSSFR